MLSRMQDLLFEVLRWRMSSDSVDPGLLTEPISDVLSRVTFNADGLVPAIAQQWDSKRVLMMAWMDEAALTETLNTRRGTYFSRSRGQRWVKGETSGHIQNVRGLHVDCDGDVVLLVVDQVGPACHTGAESCFDVEGNPGGVDQ